MINRRVASSVSRLLLQSHRVYRSRSINSTIRSYSTTMSAPQVIFSDKAASPLGPYSQAIKANGLIFCSGQIPCDKSGKLVEGSLADKTRQCIQNLSAVLEEAGSSLAKVTKTTIFLTDLSGFAEVNEEYAKHFPARPARSTIGVKQLPLGVPVEIECIAIA